jgi:hypothetical protein
MTTNLQPTHPTGPFQSPLPTAAAAPASVFPLPDQYEKTAASAPEADLKSEINNKTRSALVPHRFHLQAPRTYKDPIRKAFHMLANEFGSKSSYEGGGPEEMECFYDYLSDWNKTHQHPLIEKFLIRLKNAITLAKIKNPNDFVRDATKAIEDALKAKEPLLLAGGWIGVPFGHAMYYDIIPDEKGTVTFRVYNSGAGLGYHGKALDGTKIKYQPYVDWQGVDPQKLLCTSFLRAIHEMNWRKPNMEGNLGNPDPLWVNPFGPHDIYNGLKEYLEPKSTEEGKLTFFVSPQTSGICTVYGLWTTLRTLLVLGDKEGEIVYQRANCDMTIQSLSDFVQTKDLIKPLKEPDKKGYYSLNEKLKELKICWRCNKEAWTLVENSTKGVGAKIIRLHSFGIIDSTYVESAKKILEPVEEWLIKNQTTRQPLYLFTSFENLEILYFANTPIPPFARPLLEKDAKAGAIALVDNPHAHLIETFRGLIIDETTTSEGVEKVLLSNEVQKLASQAWLAGSDLALHAGLNIWISTLPFSKEYWVKACKSDKKRAQEFIIALGDIGRFYFQTCYTIPNAHILLPERVFMLYRLQKIQTDLVNVVTGFQHQSSDSKFSLLTRFLTFFYPKEIEEMYSPVFLSVSGTSILNDYHNVHGGTYVPYLKFEIDEYNRLSTICQIVESGKEELSEKLKKELAEPEEHRCIKVAKIHSSSHLPPWLSSWRDVNLAMQRILSCPLDIPSDVNRQQEMKFCFQIEQDANRPNVSFAYITFLSQTHNTLFSQYPILKERLGSYTTHAFLLMHGNISSEPLRKLLSKVGGRTFENGTWWRDAEKKLLLENRKEAKALGLPEEEALELLHIFESSFLAPIEALDYFSRHSSQLKDRDYQIIFRIALFQMNQKWMYPVTINPTHFLYKKLHHPAFKGFADQLKTFLEMQYKHCAQYQMIQPAVFLLNLQRCLHRFDPKRFPDTIPSLMELLNRRGILPEERSVVYCELIAAISEIETDKLKEEQIKIILQGIAYLHEFPISKKWAEPMSDSCVRKAPYIHAKAIGTYLQQPPKALAEFLNGILHIYYPNAGDTQWVAKNAGSIPTFTSLDNRYFYNPVTGRFIDFNDKNSRLPEEICRHPHFQKLFPEIERAQPQPIPEGILYVFRDMHNILTHVCMIKDKLMIEQATQKYGWTRYLPQDFLLRDYGDWGVRSSIKSRSLVQDYTHWLTVFRPAEGEKESVSKFNEATLLIRHPKSAEASYTCNIKLDLSQSKKEVPDCGLKNLRDVKLDLEMRECSNLMSEFESPSYVHEWVKTPNSLPSKIELPRFELSFTEVASKQYQCDQMKEYFLIIEKGPIPQLLSYRHYLLLKNAEGHIKVFLPYQNFKNNRGQAEVLRPTFARDQKLGMLDRDLQKYLVFDLAKDGSLISESREANLYLATVLTLVQNYNAAAKCLKLYGEKMGPYSDQEAQNLEKLCSLDKVSANMTGDACVLRTYAGYLLLKNDLMYQRTHPKLLSALHRSYLNYLIHMQHVTVLHLQPKDELVILTNIIPLLEKEDPILLKRLRTLDPSSTIRLKLQTKFPAKRSWGKAIKGLVVEKLKSIYKDARIAFENESVTRIGRTEDYVSGFYNFVLSATEKERLSLKLVKSFLKASPHMRDRAFGVVFDRFLDCSKILPNVNENYSKWSDEVDSKILPMLALEEIPEKPAPTPVKDDQTTVKIEVISDEPSVAKPAINFQVQPVKRIEWPQVFEANFCVSNSAEADSKASNAAEAWVKRQSELVKDELQKQAYESFSKDFVDAGKQAQSPRHKLKDGIQHAEIKKALMETDAKAKMETIKSEILKVANRLPIGENSKISHEQLVRMANQRQEITLDDVIICYAKHKEDPAALRRINPHLEDAEINALFAQVTEYLMHSTHEQQRKRALKTCETLEKCKDPAGQKDLTHQLALDLSAKQHYRVAECPHYLVFEHYAGILMRQDQVVKLEGFLKSGDTHPVMEMIMGSGKSKVLLPLLAKLLARPGCLATFIVPQSLFASVADDTQRSIQKSFGISLRTIHFDRHTPINVPHLGFILRELVSARDHCEPVIITNKTLKCLMLKFTEACDRFIATAKPDDAWPEEISLMREILKCFSESQDFHCMAVIDEIDTVMNVLRKICFSMGPPRAPKEHEVRVLMHLDHLLSSDQQLKAIARCECDPNPNPKAPALTKEIYEKQLKRPLAKAFIASFVKIKFGVEQYDKSLQGFVAGLNENTKAELENYLCHDKTGLNSAQKYFNAQAPEVQEILRLAGQLIGQFFAHTRTRVNDQNYGVDPDSKSAIAIPFTASKVPSKGSQFANPHITMVYTVQALIQKGITRQLIQNEIERLQSQSQRELKEGVVKSIEETLAWKKFCKLKGKLPIQSLYPKPV